MSVGNVSRWSIDDFSRWFQFVVSVGSQSVGSVDEYIRAINLLCFVELTVGASFLGEALGCHAEQDKLRHFLNEHLTAVVNILRNFRLGNSIHFSDVFSASHLTPRTVSQFLYLNCLRHP